MKKFLMIVLAASALAAAPAISNAQECADTVNVKVNGLVCDFCARALEKVLGKREEVASMKVDLDSGLVSVSMKLGKNIDDEKMTKLVTDSGYAVTGIERSCPDGHAGEH